MYPDVFGNDFLFHTDAVVNLPTDVSVIIMSMLNLQKHCSNYVNVKSAVLLQQAYALMLWATLRASLSGTFLQGRKDVVNCSLEFGTEHDWFFHIGLPQWDTVDSEIKIPCWEPRADK